MRENPDIDKEDLEESRRVLRVFHRRYGDQSRMLILVARLTGRDLFSVAAEWEQAGTELDAAMKVVPIFER